ncbi:g280 [Coccomyxa viridis]|uniref:G280 protein n=1 Tax=Coccomyxa viridis TaxID=1274662 RepID=A0ABP1FIA1_9CHLO
MQMQEVKDEVVLAVDNTEDNQLEWRSSRGRGRSRKSLEGAELSLQTAPSAGKRRGRPLGKAKSAQLSDSLVIKLDLQVDCTASQSEEKKNRRKNSNPIRSAFQ